MTQRLQDRNTKLEDLNQALADSLETLQLAQEELLQAEKMAALGHLVAGIAHEVNPPIGIGVTAASYLEEKTQEIEERYDESRMKRSDLEKYFKTARESTSMILKNLQRAAEQIQGFKQVAVDHASSEERRFTLKDYIDDLLISLHPKLKQTRHTINVQCPEKLEITSYPGAFSQIITNLLINSLDHGFEDEKHGEIILDVSRQDGILQIQFSDNGKGMTQEERSQIFEPFYTTKRGRGGSGLGLYIVYNVVTQRLNGVIECQSSLGTGTTFIIQLPIKTSFIPR